jgi:hypothetical protein
MESFYLDTALLAVPNYAIDGEAAKELIDRVNYFAQLALPNMPVKLIIADHVETLLWGANLGPDFEQVSGFLAILGIEGFFSANDLVRQYQTIMDHALRPALNNLFPAALRPETERIFATVAALQLLEDSWSVGSAIPGMAGDIYVTEAQVNRATGPRVGELGQLPAHISMPVRAVSHLRELVASATAERLWVTAESARDLHFAITVAALALLKTAGRNGTAVELRRFSIGSDFFDSLHSCQCSGKGRFSAATLSLCAQLVAGVCNKRIGVFGRPTQKRRSFDSAGGCRVHLTKGAQGLRLMYWDCGTSIEFSNIGVKNEVQIADGRPGGGVWSNLNESL